MTTSEHDTYPGLTGMPVSQVDQELVCLLRMETADGKDGGDELGSHPLLHDLEVSAGVGGHDRPTLSKYSLMASYGMAAWAWRSWEFAVALLLIELYPNSLLMVSAYGIADNLVRVALGSFIGAWVGRQQLVPAATAMYLTQNTCIGLSAGSALMLLMPRDVPLPPQVHWALLGVMIGLGALSSVGSAGVRITVEAEAVTALAAKDSQKLSQLNASFRAIDLLCLLAAPMVVGAVLTFLGPMAGTLLLTGYTLLAWMPEIALLRLAVHSAEALRTFKRQELVSDEEVDNASQALDDEEEQQEEYVGYQVEADTSRRRNSLAVYFRNPVLLPNLALAVLYCTVLSLGFLMTGYLQWTGLTSAEVSVYRGAGALTGLAATVLFPTLRRWLGLVSVGMFGIAYQVLCLTLGVAPVMLTVLAQPGGPGADLQPSVGLVRVLVAGVVASRTGLWTFDLAVTQLIQERCPPQDLSTVCGVQSSLQACFEMTSFLAGVYLHDPHVFYWLMLGSLGVVTLAALLYTKFAITQACTA